MKYVKVGKNWQRVKEAEPEAIQPEIIKPAPKKKTTKKAAN
jgi:hypothetical protein